MICELLSDLVLREGIGYVANMKDRSPVFLTKWMHAVRKGNVAVHKS